MARYIARRGDSTKRSRCIKRRRRRRQTGIWSGHYLCADESAARKRARDSPNCHRANRSLHCPATRQPMFMWHWATHDNAIQELERACEQRSSSLHMVGIAPEFIPLRSDKRFLSILRKIGLDPEKVFAVNAPISQTAKPADVYDLTNQGGGSTTGLKYRALCCVRAPRACADPPGQAACRKLRRR